MPFALETLLLKILIKFIIDDVFAIPTIMIWDINKFSFNPVYIKMFA